MVDTAKSIIIFGVVLIILGGIFLFVGKVPWIGKLPGDIVIKRENFTLYAPITTSILISIILSILLFLFRR
jgi:uncharacterized protein HemY